MVIDGDTDLFGTEAQKACRDGIGGQRDDDALLDGYTILLRSLTCPSRCWRTFRPESWESEDGLVPLTTRAWAGSYYWSFGDGSPIDTASRPCTCSRPTAPTP